jgi:hypothetical protein
MFANHLSSAGEKGRKRKGEKGARLKSISHSRESRRRRCGGGKIKPGCPISLIAMHAAPFDNF